MKQPRTHLPRLALCVVATLLTATGCSSLDDLAPNEPAPLTTFSISRVKGGVNPVLGSAPVTFTAKNGSIADVTLVGPDGKTVANTVGADGTGASWQRQRTQWSLGGVLKPATTYQATVNGYNADGVRASKTFAFATTKAPLLEASMYPGDHDVVGVGMPIRVQFNTDVPDRANVERALTIRTTPKVNGSWGWIDDRTVMWRPATFWPAKTTVNAAVAFSGHYLGDGVFGGTKRTVNFAVGRDLRMSISNASKTMTVTQDGKKIGSLPVSLGKPGHTTRSGTKIVYAKSSPYTMRGPRSDPYVVTVRHAQRITDSGEFLHAAPWSVGDQGRRNVSHGCTNLSPRNARWLYGRTIMGDPVITTGTSRKAETWNGLGGIWNYTWAQWQQQSALAKKPAAAPDEELQKVARKG